MGKRTSLGSHRQNLLEFLSAVSRVIGSIPRQIVGEFRGFDRIQRLGLVLAAVGAIVISRIDLSTSLYLAWPALVVAASTTVGYTAMRDKRAIDEIDSLKLFAQHLLPIAFGIRFAKSVLDLLKQSTKLRA